MKWLYRTGLTLVITVAPNLANATTLYINDVFYAPLRTGPSNSHRIIHAGLPSGTVLEKLETSGDFTQVKTENGQVGWLRSNYLTEKPIAKIQLAEANKQIALLSQGQKPALEKLQQLQKQHKKLNSKLQASEEKNRALVDKLKKIATVSAKPMEIAALNEKLLRDKEILSNEVDVLKAENTQLKNSSERETIINTLLAVSFGVALTILLPLLKPAKRRNDDWG